MNKTAEEIVKHLDSAGCFHSYLSSKNKEKALGIINSILSQNQQRIQELERALNDCCCCFRNENAWISGERIETWESILKK